MNRLIAFLYSLLSRYYVLYKLSNHSNQWSVDRIDTLVKHIHCEIKTITTLRDELVKNCVNTDSIRHLYVYGRWRSNTQFNDDDPWRIFDEMRIHIKTLKAVIPFFGCKLNEMFDKCKWCKQHIDNVKLECVVNETESFAWHQIICMKPNIRMKSNRSKTLSTWQNGDVRKN